jgi:hypothetical protein
MTSVPPAAIGRASGTLNMGRQLGGVFGVAICAAVFAAHGGYASPAAFAHGFGPAMGACAALALLGAAAGLAIPGFTIAPVEPLDAEPPGRSHHGPQSAPGSSRTPEFSPIDPGRPRH